jgi:hypothetical protein
VRSTSTRPGQGIKSIDTAQTIHVHRAAEKWDSNSKSSRRTSGVWSLIMYETAEVRSDPDGVLRCMVRVQVRGGSGFGVSGRGSGFGVQGAGLGFLGSRFRGGLGRWQSKPRGVLMTVDEHNDAVHGAFVRTKVSWFDEKTARPRF